MNIKHIEALLDEIDNYITDIADDLQEDDLRPFWIIEYIKKIKEELGG